MPHFSAFTSFGLLEFSSAPSHAELFYDAQKTALGGQYDLSEGTHMEASIYARSMAMGVTRRLLQHAGEQQYPMRLVEMLPLREDEYGIVPAGTLDERRREVAARRMLPRGASRVAIETALDVLLGVDFIGYYTPTVVDSVLYPAALGDQPMNLQGPDVPRRLFRIEEQILVTGSPVTVRIAPIEPAIDVTDTLPEGYLAPADVLVVHPENDSMMERVTVESLDVEFDTEYYLTITATFTKVHPSGIVATTSPFPFWASTKRHNIIMLSASGAADQDTRRRVHELLSRALRGVSTWNIAGEGTPGSGVSGPFQVGVGQLGITTIGEIDVG
jgi:hypothetical protein